MLSVEIEAIHLLHPHPDLEGACDCVTQNYQIPTYDAAGVGTFVFVDPDGNEWDYPAEYGTGECRNWCNGLGPNCDDPDNLSNICTMAWCYVDPNTCTTADLPDLMTSSIDDRLSWSFANCGASSEGSSTTNGGATGSGGSETGAGGSETGAGGDGTGSGDAAATGADETGVC